MTKISIWDNEGETFDRYTVLVYDNQRDTGSVFGISENATGFNQYCGEFGDDFTDLNYTGKKLDYIPEGIKKAILDRLENNQSKDLQIV